MNFFPKKKCPFPILPDLHKCNLETRSQRMLLAFAALSSDAYWKQPEVKRNVEQNGAAP